MNERLEKLLDEVAHEIAKIWDGEVTASISVGGEYRSITVVEWEEDKEKPVELRKRRELYGSWHNEGKPWEPDQSEAQNEYCRGLGCLLEKEA